MIVTKFASNIEWIYRELINLNSLWNQHKTKGFLYFKKKLKLIKSFHLLDINFSIIKHQE